MGYNNPDRRVVKVSKGEKRHVVRLRRRAEKREVNGEHPRGMATKATRRGWWYA